MPDPVSALASERGLPPVDIAFMRAFLRELCYAKPNLRTLYATALSRLRRHCCAAILDQPTDAAASVAGRIGVDGIAELDVLVAASRAAEMLAHFQTCQVYAGHVFSVSDGVPRALEETKRVSHYGCYAPDDVLRCPHLLEIANDPHLLQIAEAYLGCPPTIYHINAWWSFAQSGTAARWSQSLHRDLDDLRFVTLFIYLTPVDERTGAHRYIKHSHDFAQLTERLTAQGWLPDIIRTTVDMLFSGPGYENSSLADELLGQLATVWTGPAGSAVLADTYGLHMGIPLVEGQRLMAWIRYGLGMPPEPAFGGGSGKYAALVRPRLPATDRAEYINRLLLSE